MEMSHLIVTLVNTEIKSLTQKLYIRYDEGNLEEWVTVSKNTQSLSPIVSKLI